MRWFAIISAPRSGTHMLATALHSLPGVAVSGEMFGFGIHHKPLYAYCDWRRTAAAIPGIEFAGTLIHREPLRSHIIEEWNLTLSLHDRFVCLRRENTLRRLLSIMAADFNQRWGCTRPRRERETPPPLHIDPAGLWEFHERTEADRIATESLLPGHCEVVYERLIDDWKGEMARILSYLGVPAARARARTKQQETRTLPESIANYDEVAESVRSKGFRHWLDEGLTDSPQAG